MRFMPLKTQSPLDTLERVVSKYRNREEAAKAIGISESYLNDLIHERRDFSDQMLERIGLKREYRIVRLTPKEGR